MARQDEAPTNEIREGQNVVLSVPLSELVAISSSCDVSDLATPQVFEPSTDVKSFDGLESRFDKLTGSVGGKGVGSDPRLDGHRLDGHRNERQDT
jgi:hypothetical protein